MFVKVHYSGLAISYSVAPRREDRPKLFVNWMEKPPDTSRINRQKRQVHDAVEWMRRNATHKPLIMCLTCPVVADYKFQNGNLSKFFENLRTNYGCCHYCWVREYQTNGRPHYHVVADIPFVDVKPLSITWSRLFESDAVNSIRLGTAPPNRKYFIDSPMMARYMTKYMGKGIGKKDMVLSGKKLNQLTRSVRTFGISQQARKGSAPVLYQVEYIEQYDFIKGAYGLVNGTKVFPGDQVRIIKGIDRKFELTEESALHLADIHGSVPVEMQTFDDTRYSWVCPRPKHRVYYGVPKRKTSEKTRISQTIAK